MLKPDGVDHGGSHARTNTRSSNNVGMPACDARMLHGMLLHYGLESPAGRACTHAAANACVRKKYLSI
jgi:hypothetical protein